ncbi:MAG TPA: 50S ribosomal protein L21, partial [Solirubrobacteraceae bacterium]
LETLLFVGDDDPVDGGTVSAEIVGHERGPKLRVVKFKPKRGYKRRTGHRQELTRVKITSVGKGKG